MRRTRPDRPAGYASGRFQVAGFALLILAGIFLAGYPASAQDAPPVLMENKTFVRDIRQAIDSVYDMDYKASVRILAPWRQKYPHHPIWEFWEGLHLWWQILPDLENKKHDDQLIHYFSQTEYRCSRLLDKHPAHLDALLLKSASAAFLARFYANRDEWLHAFKSGKVAMNTLFTLKKADPEFPDLGFGLGAYNYYSAWLPERYPILKGVMWLLPRGNKGKGLHALRAAADSSILVKPEAIYTLARIYFEAEQKPDSALWYFHRLVRLYPQNLYYQTLFAYVLFKEGHYPLALSTIHHLLENENEIRKKSYGTSVLEHLYGIQAMVDSRIGDWPATISSCKKSRMYSLESAGARERSYYALTGFLMGRIYEEMKQDQQAKEIYRETAELKSGSPYVKEAQKRLRKLK